ncbi:hypothetical protein F4810DRAFT_673912 [Camillea tinctor]|nr:hypothetical protein F4810DRAFT_673912 [Camillea tinctor]
MSSDDMRRSFQEELDRYDSEIESLRLGSGEWVAPPSRNPLIRIGSKEYHQENARNQKRWSFTQSFMYGMASASLRNTDQVQRREAYAPGVIFSAPFHSASSTGEAYVKFDDPNMTATPFGMICSKYRKMVILKTFGEHCVCAPIYTHNGLGLQGKKFPDEYVSIRDIDDPRPEIPEGRHRVLLSRKYQSCPSGGIRGKSVVKLSESHCHRYDAPATLEGILDSKSLSMVRLLEMVRTINS